MERDNRLGIVMYVGIVTQSNNPTIILQCSNCNFQSCVLSVSKIANCLTVNQFLLMLGSFLYPTSRKWKEKLHCNFS